jgi:hypothetical protein
MNNEQMESYQNLLDTLDYLSRDWFEGYVE